MRSETEAQHSVIATSDGRQIEWCFDRQRDAARFYNKITASGRTPDTDRPVVAAEQRLPTGGVVRAWQR